MRITFSVLAMLFASGILSSCGRDNSSTTSPSPSPSTPATEDGGALIAALASGRTATYSIREAYDEKIGLTKVQFSNSNMRVVYDDSTYFYQGPISKYSNFNSNCIGGEGDLGQYYICHALNDFKTPARSSIELTDYEFVVKKGEVYYQKGNGDGPAPFYGRLVQ